MLAGPCCLFSCLVSQTLMSLLSSMPTVPCRCAAWRACGAAARLKDAAEATFSVHRRGARPASWTAAGARKPLFFVGPSRPPAAAKQDTYSWWRTTRYILAVHVHNWCHSPMLALPPPPPPPLATLHPPPPPILPPAAPSLPPARRPPRASRAPDRRPAGALRSPPFPPPRPSAAACTPRRARRGSSPRSPPRGPSPAAAA